MKISCQSCQAKYTIADEKVLGKIVKIRCKKCGATIVINGNETAAAPSSQDASGGNVFDYTAQTTSSSEQWTVNVADGDQRTMTPGEILQEFKAGVINEETYCWKDGMSDWLPLREIDQLYSLATGTGEPSLSPDQTNQEQPSFDASPDAPASAPRDEPREQREPGGGFLFGGGGGADAGFGAAAASTNGNGLGGGLFGAAATTAARRAGGRAAGGADLFGGVAQAGGEDDVMTSAPAGMPQPSSEPGKLTGQRNENSVLFSLSALTEKGPEKEAAAAAAPGGVEGSGLIDIRALSATMGDKKENRANHVDDIMNLGGGGAFTAALAAPVLAPPVMDASASDVGMAGGGKNNKILFAIIGAGALIALAIVLVFALRKPEVPETALSPTPTSTPTTVDTTGTSTPTPAPVATETTAAAAGAAATPPGAAAPGTGQPIAENRPASRSSGGGGGGGSHAKHDEPSSAPPAAIPPSPPPASKPSSLGDALKSAAGGSEAPSAPAPAAGGSAPFDRGAAAAALGSVNVQSCSKPGGPTGSGHVKVTFSPNGTVQSAVVDTPPFAGTPVGGCVAGKYRSAHIPAFSGSPQPVGKSFVIN